MNYDHVKYPIRKVNYIPSKIVLPEFWFLVYLELQKFGLYFLFTAWLSELSLKNVFKWLNAKDYLVGIENRIRILFMYLLWVRIIYFIHYYGKEYSDTFFCVSELETAWNLYTYIFVCVCMCICVCVCGDEGLRLGLNLHLLLSYWPWAAFRLSFLVWKLWIVILSLS